MSDAVPKAVFRDALPLGTVIHGYTIRAVLGRGGFGTTYHATDQLGQSFAIKEYFPRQFAMRQRLEVVAGSEQDQANLADCRQRFLFEAKTLCQLGKTAADDGIVKALTGGTCNEALAFAPTRKYGQVRDGRFNGIGEPADRWSRPRPRWLRRELIVQRETDGAQIFRPRSAP